jgi:hypothetical protein
MRPPLREGMSGGGSSLSSRIRALLRRRQFQGFYQTNYKRILLLKIDIEGLERELLGSSTRWIEQVDNIVIELHGVSDQKPIFRQAIGKRQFDISNMRRAY